MSFGAISAQADTQSTDTQAVEGSQTKPKASEKTTTQSKAPKTKDDLDAFFKRGEDDVKAGNHCFDDKVVSPPKKSESKPIA